jgi:uncharacterized protein involved in outer membrane biogenesis
LEGEDPAAVKKILAVVAGVVLLLLIAVLVVPQFIDWNRYKGDIAAEASRLTGRDVTIGGDIGFSVLPAPALVVNDLRVANLPGGVATDMARLRKAEVHVALMPLLSRRIEVTQVTLVEPVIALEVLADGRNNWTFTPDADEAPPETPPAEPRRRNGVPDVRLDEVEIEGATITYRDVAAGTIQRIEQLDASIEAASLQGPITSTGSFRAEGIPISFAADLGAFGNGAPVPVTLTLASPAGDVRAVVRGTAEDLETDARFQGRIEAQAGNLAGAIQTVAGGPLPGFLAQQASMAFDLDASAQRASIDGLALRLGETMAEGAATLDFREDLSLAAQLAAGMIDLDSWLAMPDTAPAPAAADARPGQEGAQEGAAEPAEQTARTGDGAQPGFQLPADVTAAVTFAVEAITFKEDVIRQVRADADLADGRMTLSRLSALLPGGAEAAMVGALAPTDGEARFEGQLEARAADLRTVLRWLDIDVAAVPAGRLRTLQLNSDIIMTPQLAEARNLDLRVDNTTIGGRMQASLTERPAVAVDLAVDRLNLDAYLPDSPRESPAETPAATSAEAPPAPADPLQDFDADIAVRVGTLTYNGAPASDVVFNGRLDAGTLTLARASIGDFAGATATVSGIVRGLPEQPVMENLAVDFVVPDPARLLRSLDQEVPAQAQALGAVSGSGRLNGPLDAPVVDLGVEAAGANITLAGTLNPAPGVVYDGRVGLAAAEPARLISALAPDYRPAGPLGSIDIGAALAVREEAIAISNLSGQLAGAPVSGSITMTTPGNTGGPRPHIAADLVTGRLVLDPWLPADQSAAAPAWIVPATWRQPAPLAHPGRRPELIAIAAEVHSRWSREPIDLGALRDFDADLRLRSEAIVYQGHVLDAADVSAVLAGGVLTADPVRGTFYGGPLAVTARVDATGVPAVTITMNVDGADLGRAPAAPEGISGGRLVADARLATRGASTADLVSALGGEGSFAVRGLDPNFDASGLPVVGPILGPTMRLAGAINTNLGPLLGIGSGRTGPGLADISAPFTIDQGVAHLDPIHLNTPIYNASARGTADLAAWRIDMTGEMTLAQSVLGTLLEGVREVPGRCTFGAEGPLDRPNVAIGGECLPRGITIPGTGERGLGRVLEGLIPREILPQRDETPPPEEEPAPAPAPSPEETTPEPAPQQPERVIRDLLEGLIRR